MPALLTLAITAALVPASHGRADPGFHGRVAPIDARTRARMSGVSMHRGCPVGFAGLRLLTITHWGFDGRVHRGPLAPSEGDGRRPHGGAFAAVGWGWGGNWAWPKDFQHFSASGH